MTNLPLSRTTERRPVHDAFYDVRCSSSCPACAADKRPLQRSEVTPIPKAPKVTKTAKKRAKKDAPAAVADRLFGAIVRSRGECEIKATGKCPNGPLQCCHIVSRRYRAVRWEESNALAGCAGCHMFMTLRPLHWEQWVDEHLGYEFHVALKARAMGQPNPKLPAVVARLQARWDAIERSRPNEESA